MFSDKERLLENRMHGSPSFPFALYEWDGCAPLCVGHHWHKELEIIYLEQGAFDVSVNTERFSIHAPALVFAAGGDIHSVESAEDGRERAAVFSPEIVCFRYYDEIYPQVIIPIEDGSALMRRVLTPSDTGFAGAEQLFLSVCRAAVQDGAVSRLRIRAFLAELFALLCENGYITLIQPCIAASVGDRIRRIKRMLGYLKEHYREHIRLDDAALLLGMNSQYFCRFFHKMMGKTFTAYLNELRIEACAGELEGTDKRIIDIALDNGFDNAGYFIRRFRESRRMTPLEYRRLKQKK